MINVVYNVLLLLLNLLYIQRTIGMPSSPLKSTAIYKKFVLWTDFQSLFVRIKERVTIICKPSTFISDFGSLHVLIFAICMWVW